MDWTVIINFLSVSSISVSVCWRNCCPLQLRDKWQTLTGHIRDTCSPVVVTSHSGLNRSFSWTTNTREHQLKLGANTQYVSGLFALYLCAIKAKIVCALLCVLPYSLRCLQNVRLSTDWLFSWLRRSEGDSTFTRYTATEYLYINTHTLDLT